MLVSDSGIFKICMRQVKDTGGQVKKLSNGKTWPEICNHAERAIQPEKKGEK